MELRLGRRARAGSRRPPRSSCTRATPPSAWTRSRASATCAWRCDGTLLAESRRPTALFETWLPTRWYLPAEDVHLDRLEPSGTVTRCPYKGQARFWALPGGRDLAWSYPEPIPECPRIAGLVAFFNEHVDLTVDGEPQPRPFTPWSLGLPRLSAFASLPPAHDAHRGRIHRLRRRRDPVGQPRPAAGRLGRALRHRLVAVRRDPHRRAGRRRLRGGRVRDPRTTAASTRTTSSTSPGGKTFFWAGRYHRDINQRDTLQTDLNVFQDFEPKLSEASRAADVVFLANIQPDLQREVREQCTQARFVAMDSMNFWIESAHGSLLADDLAHRLPRAQRRRARAAHRRAQPDPRRPQGARARARAS